MKQELARKNQEQEQVGSCWTSCLPDATGGHCLGTEASWAQLTTDAETGRKASCWVFCTAGLKTSKGELRAGGHGGRSSQTPLLGAMGASRGRTFQVLSMTETGPGRGGLS